MTEFELKVGERAARAAAPGMGGFAAREIAKAVIEAVDKVRSATPVTVPQQDEQQ